MSLKTFLCRAACDPSGRGVPALAGLGGPGPIALHSSALGAGSWPGVTAGWRSFRRRAGWSGNTRPSWSTTFGCSKTGTFLFADGDTVTEVTPEKRVVFQYKSESQQGGGTYACQRLDNGRTLIGENSTGRVLEVDSTGKVLFSLQTQPFKAGQHHNMRMARKLVSGNYLVCHSGRARSKNTRPRARWSGEVKAPGGLAFAALRTPRGTNGRLQPPRSNHRVRFLGPRGLGVCLQGRPGRRGAESDRAALAAGRADSPRAATGPTRGARAAVCWRSHPKKRVAWRYVNPKADGTMMAVQLLSPEGRPLAGPCLR